ncbi:MAG: hypothetical protein U0599_11185 [Vicinamibacteria bacterium]
MAFMLVSYALGGDACNGRTQNGAFFVGDHGVYTQVTELTYWLSYLHGLSVVLAIGAAALGGRYLERQRDPVLAKWMGPFGKIVVAIGVAGIVAWSFKLPAGIVIPVLLVLAVATFVLYWREYRGSHAADDE